MTTIYGLAMTGVTNRRYTANDQPRNARVEHWVAWCSCGWRSRTVEGKTRANRRLLAHMHVMTDRRMTHW